MSWLSELLWGSGVAHTILLFAVVIAFGIMLGHVKIFGVSLGMTMVLFVGIFFSHFGFRVDHEILHFVKEFGLILFVYAIGLQVGPGFLGSLKKGGLTLNTLAAGIVLLGILTTISIHFLTGIPMNTMVGILSGAVTNTPGLGAAQNASESVSGAVDPNIALGYAVAYPLGVVGIILSIIIIRLFFKVNFDQENQRLKTESAASNGAIAILSFKITNPAIFGKSLCSITSLINRKLVVSRICHANGQVEVASSKSVLHENDILRVITSPTDEDAIRAFIGEEVDMDLEAWNKLDKKLVSRRILVTQSNINGKKLEELHLRNRFDVTVTRVNRSGIDLIATPNLKLHVGDRLTVVGSHGSIVGVEKIVGNELKRLNSPNLIPIFIGIALGVLLGSIPVFFPGIPQPIRLGLAGGPLIVAILISIFGTKLKLVTYTTMSANLMIREIGIALFLACVGIGAGEGFVDTIINGGGWQWIGWGVIITMLPLIIIGIIGRKGFKMNYFTLAGLLAGSTTDPPALAYASSLTSNDKPAVSYATVYPLTMFLRVMGAQLLILLFA